MAAGYSGSVPAVLRCLGTSPKWRNWETVVVLGFSIQTFEETSGEAKPRRDCYDSAEEHGSVRGS